jgi:chromosome segregation ATPase
MRTREKVLVLLVSATLFLGSLIYFAFKDNELEANYFRWLFSNTLNYGLSSPSKFISEEVPSGAFVYGGLTIFAVVMFLVFLKMTRDRELLALRKRLSDLRSEKNQTDSLLQEVVWKGKTEQQAKESVRRDLEVSIDKIEALVTQLNEKEDQLRTRDIELVSLKSNALAEAGPGRPLSDRLLRQEIHNKTEMLQAKTAALKDLEQRMNAKTRLWENQAREKDALLKRRDADLEGLRGEIAALNSRVQETEAAKKRAEELFQAELKKTKEILEANDLATRAEEKRLTDKIRTVENQLGEKDRLLRARDTEINGFRKQLSEFESAQAQMEARHREELAKSEQDRRAKEHGLATLEERLSANIRDLQNEVSQKDLLLQARDSEMRSVKSEVKAISLRLSEMAAAKVHAEEALQEELKKAKSQRETEQNEFREREDRYEKEASLFTQQLSEKEDLLKHRNAELDVLRQDVQGLGMRLDTAVAAKERAEGALREALEKAQIGRQSSEAAERERQQRYAREVQALQNQLGEKDQSLERRGEEIKSLKTQVASLTEQLAKVGSAKERAASLLQEKLKAERQSQHTSDSVVREMEAGFKAKVASLEEELAAKQEVVGSRDAALTTLKSELASLNQRMSDLAAAKERAEGLFQQALTEKTDLLKSKDGAAKILEEQLTGKMRGLESRLREREALLHDRESELGAFKTQLAELVAAKDQATKSLSEDVRQKSELLAAKQTAIKTLEERFSSRIHSLESALAEKQELIDAREQEFKELMAKVNALSGNLAELGTSKDGALRLLHEELKQKSELLDSKDAALAALEKRLNDKARNLENQLSHRQELLAARDAELDSLMSKVSELTEKVSELDADRDRTQRRLQEELRENNALLQSRESSISELEEQLKGRVETLERHLAEKETLLETSSAELSEFRSQFNSLTERLNEAEQAKVTLEGLLQIERSKSETALVAIEAAEQDDGQGLNGETLGLETLLHEREQLLQARDKLIQSLMTELKEKKTQLAKQEIEVWQKIERREAWKHRLSKFGIRMKD